MYWRDTESKKEWQCKRECAIVRVYVCVCGRDPEEDGGAKWKQNLHASKTQKIMVRNDCPTVVVSIYDEWADAYTMQ